tara:strand:+ start:993 stop:1499 length:507 start_codon:yes stop_codon:yes gene_type:complete
MATPTHTLIDSVTLGSSAASVTFSSISATGKGDLVLVVNAATTSNYSGASFRLNGDTGTNYSAVRASGDGSSASSTSASASAAGYLTFNAAAPTTEANNIIAQFQDFSATDKHKTVLVRSGSTSGAAPGVEMIVNRWANTSAITTLLVFTGSSFAAGSTFHLYQIVSE